MELVWLAFLEKMVKVGMTRGFAVELVVGVGGRMGRVDFGTVGAGVGTVGGEVDTVRVDGSNVGVEADSVIVTPALSQRPSVTLTMS